LGQEVKDRGHTRPKIDLEGHHSQPIKFSSLF